MRQIEFVETTRLGYNEYLAGDRKSFSDDEAAEYIRLGWAKCVATGEVGTRVPGAQALRIDPVTTELG